MVQRAFGPSSHRSRAGMPHLIRVRCERYGNCRAPSARRMGQSYDARNPDFSRFAAHGGKLFLIHGWSDMVLPPEVTIDYYERVQAKMAPQIAASFVRIYVVPGMEHGFAGPGPNAFGQGIPPSMTAEPSSNISAALDTWVEKGVASDAIVARKYDGDFKALIVPNEMTPKRTRPLCPYPQVARWMSMGSSDDAKNLRCVAPPSP